METYISVKVLKDDNALYLPDGVMRSISCNHVLEGSTIVNDTLTGYYSINMSGSIVPLPTTSIPIAVQDGESDNQTQTALIPPGTIDTTPKARTIPSSADAKTALKVKDLATLITYYVDAEDYLDKRTLCNAVPYPSACSVVTGGDADVSSDTEATISWDADLAAAGYEWINDESSHAPAGGGVFTTDNSVDLTGLTPGTEYFFHVRKICGVGESGISDWIAIQFTTIE